jgi:serine/threonine protein kinase
MTTQENLLARYSILHELGNGATGRVYAARDRETGAVVALKRIDPAFLSKCGAGFAERFVKHARSARLLKHRNIVTIHDAGEAAGTVYIVMEMLEGESLRKVLYAGPLPIARAIQITRDIASGLEHAHLQGVVHGGLKPSNIIVLRSGAVKITDFGIGQLGHAGQTYLSPEQSRGDAVDHRCDIFSLGALFYEMLTHRVPSANPTPPSELNPNVPRALDPMVLNMLAGQPVSRMPGVPVLLRELERLEEGLGLGSSANAATAEPPASAAPTAPEPEVRIRGVKRLRDREPVPDVPRRDPTPDPEAFDYQKAIAMMDRESRRERSSGSRRAIWGPLTLVLALLGIGIAGFVYYSSMPGGAGVRDVLARLAPPSQPVRQIAPPPVTYATKEPAAPQPREVPPAPVADATEKPEAARQVPRQLAPSTPPAAEPVALAQTRTESPIVHAAERPESASPAPAPAPAPAAVKKPIAKAPQPAPEKQAAGAAHIVLAISPRGEIYIDGKHHGATPPITTLALEPGLHRIEVRNGSRTPYLTYMTVQAGDVRRIRYDFDTSKAVHPRGKRTLAER